MNGLHDWYTWFGVEAPETGELFDSSDLDFKSEVQNAKSTVTDIQYTFTEIYRSGVNVTHSDEAMQLARDFLEGFYGDYVFFQDSANQVQSNYVLLMGDIDFDRANHVFTFHSGTGILFRYHNTTGTTVSTDTGSINFPSLTIVNGSGSSVASPSHSEQFSYKARTFETITSSFTLTYNDFNEETVSISDNDFFYSSFENSPHLIEGVENYAFTAFLLAAAVITFNLIDRVFRRVY